MARNITTDEMLAAAQADTAELEQTIQAALGKVDTLVAISVLARLLTEEARKLHGVTMRVVIEPK